MSGETVTTEATAEISKLAIDSGWLCHVVNYHTCGAGDVHGHEPGCGLVPLVKVEEIQGFPTALPSRDALVASILATRWPDVRFGDGRIDGITKRTAELLADRIIADAEVSR